MAIIFIFSCYGMSHYKVIILLDDNLQYVFVDREKELEFLENQFLLFKEKLSHGVIIYGRLQQSLM